MDINILTIIIGVTVIISLVAMNNQTLQTKLMFIPYDVKHHRKYERYITHLFAHADIGHLAFNMMSLYFMGSFLLTQVGGDYISNGNVIHVNDGFIPEYGLIKGQIHFVVLYFAGGIIATAIPFYRNQHNMSYRSLGASGAVSAVIFAAILWNPSTELQFLFIPIPIKAWFFGIIYLVAEYYMDRRGGGRIAHDAHIGGAIFGILYVLIINIDKGKEFFQTILG